MTNQLSEEQWANLSWIIYMIDDGKLNELFDINSLNFLHSNIFGFSPGVRKADIEESTLQALVQAGLLTTFGRYYTLTADARIAIKPIREQFRAKYESQNSDPPPPSPAPAASQPRTTPQNSLVELAHFLNDWFDRDDLENLCFDLGVDYHNLAGDKKETKARNLVTYMNNRGRLADLEHKLATERPARYKQFQDRQ